MKHFKFNISHTAIPIADLCISQVPGKEYTSVVKAFAHILNDCHIDFNIIEKENQMLVAKRYESSWSISE